MPIGTIESLDHEARGITRLDGKTIFVVGALPGETVEYTSFRKKPSFEVAQILHVHQASPARVTPKCPHFGVCGGCSLQHFDSTAQVAAKQRLLEANLWHLGRVKPDILFAPIAGEFWGYRHRARLSARFVAKKGGMLIGFHEKRSAFVADMRQCEVLPPHVSALLLPLRELIGAFSDNKSMPQIELAVGDTLTVLVLRIMVPLSAADEDLLRSFADQHDVVFYLQPKGPSTAYRFYPLDERALSYRLPDFDVTHVFSPTEFTQVNPAINRVLVRRALALLEPKAGERIADMFCGLGNFTLPIARSGAQVVGIEGSTELVQRAQQNALDNQLKQHVSYAVSNLFEMDATQFEALGKFDKMLIDPPREGALALVEAIAADGSNAPQRIIYVSCNPATLARDAAILVGEKNYRLRGAGLVNMFPQTSHLESIAWFERN